MLLPALLFALPAFAGPPPAAAPAAPAPRAEDLAWLGGCWTTTWPDGSVTQEQWLPPAGGALLGVVRTVAGGQMVSHEFLSIGAVDGRLAYVARPSGQPEATFPVVTASATEVVFENPTHDFPTRIVYRKAKDGTVSARIEGKIDGAPQAVDFPYKRCK